MVVGYVAREIFKQAFRGLYRTVNFQDKTIRQAWTRGGYGRQTIKGVRHGAGIGAATGYFINQEFGDDVEDVFQTPRNVQVPSSRKYAKARNRPTRRNYCEYPRKYKSSKRSRYT